eukprot:s3699_g3.t2
MDSTVTQAKLEKEVLQSSPDLREWSRWKLKILCNLEDGEQGNGDFKDSRAIPRGNAAGFLETKSADPSTCSIEWAYAETSITTGVPEAKVQEEMEERALRPDLCRLSTCPSRTTQLQQEPRNLATSRQTVLAAQPEVVLTLEVIRTSRTVTTLQAKKRHKAHLR